MASETSAVAVVIADNPYVFTASQQSHAFTVTAQSSTDSDDVVAIRFSNSFACQNFRIEPVALPGHVCGGSAQEPGCPKNLPFTVTYLGTGKESCDIAIDWMGGGSGSGSGSVSALTGSGTSYLRLSSDVSAPNMSVDPVSIDFGQTAIGTPSSQQLVTVTNTGSVALVVSGSLVGNGSNAFFPTPAGMAPLSSHVLGVGSADRYWVYCQPNVAGMFSAGLRFTAGSIVKTSTLTCQGVTSDLTITPSPVTFDSTLIGKPPGDQTVRITSANMATKITSVSLDATAMGNNVIIRSAPPPGSFASDEGTVILSYAADKPHDSGPLGKLVIRASTDSAPREVTINGQALVGSIGTNPVSVDFGTVCVETTSTRDVEVFANAAGSVTLSRPEPPGAPFAFVSSTGLPVVLQGNHVGGTTLHIATFAAAVGDASATLQLPTDIPNSAPYPLPLHATIVPRGIGATPDKVQFGTVVRNTSSSGREVTLTNCGSDTLTIAAASIIGNDPGEFAIVAPSDPTVSLLSTESLTFLVIMSAHDVLGDKSAKLQIEHSSGTTDVDLEGTVGSGSSGSGDRETYYGCQVGTGSPFGASGALAVAMSWLLGRRRRSSMRLRIARASREPMVARLQRRRP